MSGLGIIISTPQLFLLGDLDAGPVWHLEPPEVRPMNKLIELGFAERRGASWRITEAGRKHFNAVPEELSPEAEEMSPVPLNLPSEKGED